MQSVIQYRQPILGDKPRKDEGAGMLISLATLYLCCQLGRVVQPRTLQFLCACSASTLIEVEDLVAW